MTEVTGSDEAKPELTRSEIQWRLECALKYSASNGATLEQAAKAVNKALAILRQGEGPEVKTSADPQTPS